ncbi:MAG: glycosyltransferase family 4 protein [Flavobacteriaceae bacterium]|nr:glycosyltransferase family 4 protein [Flavobacteriaceae bacterium]
MKNNKKQHILMTFVQFSTFTKRDVSILSKKFTVSLHHFDTAKKQLLPIAFIKQFFHLLFNISDYKSIVIQSAGYVSFLPVIFGKILKKPIIIIAIGTDCAKLPEINYGANNKKILSWFTNFSFRNASLVLPVHKSLEKSFYTYLNVQFPNQGIRAFNPSIKTKIVEIVNGYDTKKWRITDSKRLENSFLTVTVALHKIGYYRKGIDLIIETAKAFPTHHFTIVGNVFLEEKCPKNVHLIDNVNQDELLLIYNKHQYYFQLSMFEGFPNALCEAMLCGCIPIGSNVAGIPDIIGDNGYVLKKKDADLLKNIISNLDKNKITSAQVREQIATNFPIERRERELVDAVLNCEV